MPSRPLVRLYGPGVERDSWGRVTAGMRKGLDAIGCLVGFFEMEQTVRDLEDGLSEGHDAPIGVYVGPPNLAHVLRSRGRHERRAVMVAANSSWLPRRVVRKLSEFATELLAPSQWSAEVVRRHSDLPVTVWRHGVDEAFCPADRPADRPDGPYRVLHLSSTTKERKATKALCQAWMMARESGCIPQDAQLDLVLSGPLAHGQDQTGPYRGMRFIPRLNMSEAGAAALYRQYDLVCQPSRAEGFGLVPLEAHASGVPVCATLCTGHGEHMHESFPGVLPVAHGQDGPVDDGPGAMAPVVRAEDIAEALGLAYRYRESLRREALAAAAAVSETWSWESVCRRWVDAHC